MQHVCNISNEHELCHTDDSTKFPTEVGVTLCRCADPRLWRLCHMMLLQVGRHLVRSRSCTHHGDVPLDVVLPRTSPCPTVSPEFNNQQQSVSEISILILISPSMRELHSAHCDYQHGTATAYLNTEYIQHFLRAECVCILLWNSMLDNNYVTVTQRQ